MARQPAGYSGTPLATKLGIGAGTSVALNAAPPGFLALLGELPPGVKVARGAGKAPIDVAVVFVTVAARLFDTFVSAAERSAPDGAVWVAWPKKTSRVETDMSE